MIAEKMPGLADGSTTLVTVCQRLAPRASEPATSPCGTLENASSETEKTSGMTAKAFCREHGLCPN